MFQITLMDCMSDEKLVSDINIVLNSTLDLRDHLEKLIEPATPEMAAQYEKSRNDRIAKEVLKR